MLMKSLSNCLGFNEEAIHRRLDNIVGSPEFARMINWPKAVRYMFVEGIRETIDGSPEQDCLEGVDVIPVGYTPTAEVSKMFTHSYRELYRFGREVGSKLKPFATDTGFVISTIADIGDYLASYISKKPAFETKSKQPKLSYGLKYRTTSIS